MATLRRKSIASAGNATGVPGPGWSCAVLRRACWVGAVGLFLCVGSPVCAAATTKTADKKTSPVTVPPTIYDPDRDPAKDIVPDYAALFAQFDQSLNEGEAYSQIDNTSGTLAWAQSYMQMAYVRQFKSTSDTMWLDKLVTQFDRVLANRDDRLGRQDEVHKRVRKGWGTRGYTTGGQWHVYVVHTGMICNGPAEFVRLVKSSPDLHSQYGATADRYLAELTAMVEDANTDFRTSGTMGYFIDPAIGDGGMIPLNMSNAMGSVIVELYRITGKPEYKEQATQLANFFRACLQKKDTHGWVWEYWPKNPGAPVKAGAAEDISHAAINIDFAVRCCHAGIGFTRKEMRNFAATWQVLVTGRDGSGRQSRRYADRVDGTGNPNSKYIPQAAGRWYPLVATLPPHQQRLFSADIKPAFAGREIKTPAEALGLANFAPYSLP